MKLASLKSQRGFTLIELVAVLAIMGILAGVVAGAVTGFGSSARETRVQGDENTIGSSADRFFDDAFSLQFDRRYSFNSSAILWYDYNRYNDWAWTRKGCI